MINECCQIRPDLPHGPLSILIAEDAVPSLEMLEFILKSFGHKVVAKAKNGEEAIRLAKKHRPDLIILDIDMPDMDGLEAAEQILAERNVPIIIATGITRDEALVRASKLNIQSYLIKPYRNLQIETSISLAMIRHHQITQPPV
ncbi:MAG: response regulator [Verrucomicrobiota bacterium]